MKTNLRVALVLLAAAGGGSAWAADGVVNTEEGVAIKGYDPVAYFTESEPVPGDPQYSYEWRGATWHFASDEHRDLFAEDPDRYTPEYGGYCAWAVAHGDTADIDPEAWHIEDGRLFLNVSKFIQLRWRLRMGHYIEEADAKWPDVRSDLQ
jgi:YHS domain-containing protein